MRYPCVTCSRKISENAKTCRYCGETDAGRKAEYAYISKLATDEQKEFLEKIEQRAWFQSLAKGCVIGAAGGAAIGAFIPNFAGGWLLGLFVGAGAGAYIGGVIADFRRAANRRKPPS